MEKKSLSIKDAFILGTQHQQKGDLKAAKKIYEDILKINPNHAESIFLLGSLFVQTKNFDKAKPLLQKTIQIQSNHTAAYNNLGIVSAELGEHKKAISYYEKAIQLNPNQAESYNNLGNVFLCLKEYQTAISYYEKAIEINPNNANTYNNLGSVFQALGEYQKAKSCYEKSIEINPNHADTHSNLGSVFLQFRKYQEAKSCFEKAIKLNPNHAKAHNHLGILFKVLGNIQKSISCYEKVIQINPSFNESHFNLGKAFEKLKEYQKAINCYKKVNSSGSRSALLECTYLLNGIKDYNKILEQFSDDDPCNIEIAAFAAYVAQKKGTKNIYPFCKNALDFVLIDNLKNEFTNSKAFSKNLLQVLEKKEYIWEPFKSNVVGGSRTFGLSLYQKDLEIVEFKKLIEKQIAIYREKYKHKEDYLITKWPLKSSIALWHNKLSKQGYLAPHIHASGWLSGVFYLKVPKLLNKDEGSIKLSPRFSRYGHDYPVDNNLPNLIHSPKDFDIILFPSSIYHQTIPFNSQDERHSVAFDLMPII